MSAKMDWLLASAMDSKVNGAKMARGMLDLCAMVACEAAAPRKLVVVACAPSETAEPWQVASAVALVTADLFRASGVGVVIEGYTADRDPDTVNAEGLQAEHANDPGSTVQRCLLAFWSEPGQPVEVASIAYGYDDGGIVTFQPARRMNAAAGPIATYLAQLTNPARRLRTMVDEESYLSAMDHAGHVVAIVEAE